MKNKVKVTLGVFLNFVYDNSYLETKKVYGYLLSLEPQMVEVHLKTTYVSSNIDCYRAGYSKVTYC